MSAKTNVPLPAGTALGKSYEYGVDVNVGTYEDPEWISIRRLFGFNHTPTPKTQDATTYDDKGSTAQEVSGWDWALAFSTNINRSATTGQYLPEIEALRQRTLPGAIGEAAEVDVRWYHKPESGKPNPVDAGRGFATVSYSRQNTGPNGETEVWAWSLTGVGSYVPIENPWTGWGVAAKPTLQSATPSGATAGQQVLITGTRFEGVTGVKFGATNASSYVVISPTTIVAVVPTGSAGSAAVTVTNGEGASDALPYTRGA